MTHRLALPVCCCLLLAWPALATSPPPPVVQTQGQAQLLIFTDFPAGAGGPTLRLSDEIRLVFLVKGRAALEVELPPKLTLAQAWTVQPLGPPTTKPGAGGVVHWSQEFELGPLQKGKHPLQLEPLRFREGDGPWQQATWKPIPVEVTAQVPKADVGLAHDITPIEALPPEESWLAWIFLVATVPAVALVVLLAWLLCRRRFRQVLPLSPERAALRELDQVASVSPETLPEAARYHTLLSGAIRRYLERRFQLPASRQTTPEFLAAMGNSPHLTAEQQTLLRDFLERCDLGKFAPVPPSHETCRQTATMARSFVEQTAQSSTAKAKQHA